MVVNNEIVICKQTVLSDVKYSMSVGESAQCK